MHHESAQAENSLEMLAEEVCAYRPPSLDPLPCDRWVARSCLQKGIRRGEVRLAQRALANLFEHDRRSVWRHLAIIALEDIGVADFAVLARIIGASKSRTWRLQQGGDWRVVAELVRQMAEAEHCQAACDLLLQSLNASVLAHSRIAALEADANQLAQTLWNVEIDLEGRALAALALGGGLAQGQQHNDPHCVLDILADAGRPSHMVATCRAAWRLTRNPMALLLPMVWEAMECPASYKVEDDPMPPVRLIHEVPSYALDQFTRIGNNVSRAFLAQCSELRAMFDAAHVASGIRSRAVGDLIFQLEGGLLRRRILWPIGDRLRMPHRSLPTTECLGSLFGQSLRLVEAKASVIETLREALFHPAA